MRRRQALQAAGAATTRENADPRLLLDCNLALASDQVRKTNLVLAGILSPRTPLDQFLVPLTDVAALERGIAVKAAINKAAKKIVNGM